MDAKTKDTSVNTAQAGVDKVSEELDKGNNSQALEIFAQNLLVEKGAYKLDAQTADIMKSELLERLNLLVNKVSLEGLNEEGLANFNRLLDKKTDAQTLQKYISDNVPDLKQRLTDAFYRFRLLYLGTR